MVSAEILECHLVAGGFDYLVKTRVADMAAYREFLGSTLWSLPGVRETRTYADIAIESRSQHRSQGLADLALRTIGGRGGPVFGAVVRTATARSICQSPGTVVGAHEPVTMGRSQRHAARRSSGLNPTM